jgi:hypothetical protein
MMGRVWIAAITPLNATIPMQRMQRLAEDEIYPLLKSIRYTNGYDYGEVGLEGVSYGSDTPVDAKTIMGIAEAENDSISPSNVRFLIANDGISDNYLPVDENKLFMLVEVSEGKPKWQASKTSGVQVRVQVPSPDWVPHVCSDIMVDIALANSDGLRWVIEKAEQSIGLDGVYQRKVEFARSFTSWEKGGLFENAVEPNASYVSFASLTRTTMGLSASHARAVAIATAWRRFMEQYMGEWFLTLSDLEECLPSLYFRHANSKRVKLGKQFPMNSILKRLGDRNRVPETGAYYLVFAGQKPTRGNRGLVENFLGSDNWRKNDFSVVRTSAYHNNQKSLNAFRELAKGGYLKPIKLFIKV